MSNAKTVSVIGCIEDLSGGGGGGGSGFSARSTGGASASAEAPGTGAENSLRLPPTAVGIDRLRLDRIGLESGLLRAHLRRGPSGETDVRSAARVMLDHPSDREVVRVSGGWRSAYRVPALSVLGTSGGDLTPLLGRFPDEWLVGDTGDTLKVQLAPDSGSAASSAFYLEAHSGRIEGVEEPCLRILHRGGDGAWLEVARPLPRSRFSNLVVEGVNGDQVRVVFRGNHAIRSLGRLVLEGSPAVVRALPVHVSHSGAGAIEPSALLEGGAGVVIGASERLDLGFTPSTEGPAQSRSFFLEVSGTSTGGDAVAARVQLGVDSPRLPAVLQLGSPVPNPARSGASLRLALPQGGRVRAEVYDLLGRRIETLASGSYPAGWHTLAWDGRGRSGERAAAGIYMIRVSAGARTFDRRLVVMP